MTTRARRAAALERCADEVDADDLVEAKTAALRTMAELAEQRDDIDTALISWRPWQGSNLRHTV